MNKFIRVLQQAGALMEVEQTAIKENDDEHGDEELDLNESHELRKTW